MAYFCKPTKFFLLALIGALFLFSLMTAHAEVSQRMKEQISQFETEVEKDPDNVDLLMELAKRYGWAKMPEETMATYERVLEVEPDNLEAMKALKDHYSWNKKTVKAVEMMQRIVILEPNNMEMKKELAKRYVWNKQQKKAITVYEEIVEFQPEDLDSRRRLADLYRWNKMSDKAAGQYEKIIELDPADMETKERLAFHYSWHKKPVKAIVLFEEIIEENPENAKAKKQLAHLYYYNQRPDEALDLYEKMVDDITTDADRLDVYSKMGAASRRTKDYEGAADYYKQILEIAPGNVEAQQRLDEVERLMSPQIFGRIDFYNAKGGPERLVQRYGFSQMLDDGYRMEARYGHRRHTELGERRLVTQDGEMEISKDFGDGLTLFGGGGIRFYGTDERVRFNYFVKAIKVFNPRLTGTFEYDKRPEDSDFDKLHQRVDRHRINTNFYYKFSDDISVNTAVWGDFLTKGEAPRDNVGYGLIAAPTLHIMRDPVVNLSYAYYRVEYARGDSTNTRARRGEFEYYNPRLYYTHSGSLYFSYEFFDGRLRTVFSDRLYFVQDEDDVNYWGNSIYGELRLKITPNDTVTAGFTRSRQIWNVQSDYQIVQQVTLRFSHDF